MEFVSFCIFRKYTFENINIFLDLFLYFIHYQKIKLTQTLCSNKEYLIK